MTSVSAIVIFSNCAQSSNTKPSINKLPVHCFIGINGLFLFFQHFQIIGIFVLTSSVEGRGYCSWLRMFVLEHISKTICQIYLNVVYLARSSSKIGIRILWHHFRIFCFQSIWYLRTATGFFLRIYLAHVYYDYCCFLANCPLRMDAMTSQRLIFLYVRALCAKLPQLFMVQRICYSLCFHMPSKTNSRNLKFNEFHIRNLLMKTCSNSMHEFNKSTSVNYL